MTTKKDEAVEPDMVKTVMVGREDGVTESTVAKTPSDQPNILIHVLSPLRVVVVRTARVYAQTFMGLFTAGLSGMDGGVLPNDVGQLAYRAAALSVAAAAVTFGQNILELLARMDEKAPQWRP